MKKVRYIVTCKNRWRWCQQRILTNDFEDWYLPIFSIYKEMITIYTYILFCLKSFNLNVWNWLLRIEIKLKTATSQRGEGFVDKLDSMQEKLNLMSVECNMLCYVKSWTCEWPKYQWKLANNSVIIQKRFSDSQKVSKSAKSKLLQYWGRKM